MPFPSRLPRPLQDCHRPDQGEDQPLPQALWLPSAEAPKLFLNRAGRVRTEHIRKAGPGHVQIGSQEVLDWTGQGQGIDRDGEILLHLS